MSSGKKYDPEFKAKVALDASAKSKKVLAELSDKYGVSESEIISWARELNTEAASIFNEPGQPEHPHDEPESEEVIVEVPEDEAFLRAVEYGGMFDDLNYGKLGFWTTLGTAVVIALVVFIIQFFDYSSLQKQQNVALENPYIEIQQLTEQGNETLNTFGVVDLENGIYRIPIDSAISRIAVD